VAIADLFEDQLTKAADYWNEVAKQKGYAGIDPKLMFKGPEAYKQIAHCKDVDMIILSTPDFFHPQHLAEIVKAGKHVYSEKPAGVDVEGCLSFIETGERAMGKLSLDVGFQVREAPCFSEVVNRIHQGAIGAVSYGSIYYHASKLTYPDYPNASPLERRIRQFYWDRVLSGDTIVDQDIHVIDMTNWVLGSHPLKAIGTGGRKVRKDASNVWDNWSVSYTYPNDVHINLSAVQFADFWDVGVRYIGDKGIGESNYNGLGRITGDQAWSSVLVKEGGDFSAAGTFDGLGDADAIKAKKFIDSIVSGKYHNQAREGGESALSAILGRMAAYQGREVTWDEMIKSKQSYKGEIDMSKL
jgi:predicted dehydrogenase